MNRYFHDFVIRLQHMRNMIYKLKYLLTMPDLKFSIHHKHLQVRTTQL